MTHKRMIKGGFTLVEILIVVVILGILAAIVIPQFTNASESAKASSMTSTLQTMRSQLELAQVQHQGTYPDLATDGWAVMTTKTEADDSYTTVAAGDESGNEVGPYMQQAPVNPFAPGDDKTKVEATASATSAWVYDNATGNIKAVINLTADQAQGLGLMEDDETTSGDDVVIYSGT